MIELGTVVKELLKAKRVENNLPQYTDGLMSLYKRVAFLRLAFNYYTFSEIYYELSDDKKSICADEVKVLQELIINTVLENNMTFSEAEDKITALRNEIISKMDAVTAYTDKLSLYEYILNRVEFKFTDCEFDNNYYKNHFENDIYNYVILDKDNSAINMKLSMVMGELPMRLSRNKFFDILRDSFSIYKGSEKMAVEDFIYRIKTAGGIYSTKEMENKYPKLKKAVEELSKVNYSDISEKEYTLYRDKLDVVAGLAMDYGDSFIILAEIVNDIYSILLCDNASFIGEENDKLKAIIEYCYSAIEENEEPDTIWAEKFVEFEGIQEKLRYMLDAPENALQEIYNINEAAINEGKMTESFNKLFRVNKLQSSSTFVTFNEEDNLKEEADDEYINKAVDLLISDFSNCFENSSRTYMRAVMAGVISNVPAYFNNLTEFQDYVHVSLNQCNDEAEQKACMTLINMLIASE